MAEWLLGLGALSSLVLILVLFYFLIRYRDFYVSEEGKRRIEKQKIRLKVPVILGIAAFFLFVGIELLEAAKVMGSLPEFLEGIEEPLELGQLVLMLLAQFLLLSIAVGIRKGEKVAAG